LPAPIVNDRGDSFWKWLDFQLWRACELDLGSVHTACRHASLIDLYLHAKFHWNRVSFFCMDWTDVRTYAWTDGHLTSALLGGLCRRVDLKTNKQTETDISTLCLSACVDNKQFIQCRNQLIRPEPVRGHVWCTGRLGTVPAYDGRTDRQTQGDSKYCACIVSCGKKIMFVILQRNCLRYVCWMRVSPSFLVQSLYHSEWHLSILLQHSHPQWKAQRYKKCETVNQCQNTYIIT